MSISINNKKWLRWCVCSVFAISTIVFFLIYNNTMDIIYLDEVNRTVERSSEYADLTLVLFSDIHHDPVYEVNPMQETLANVGAVGKRIKVDALWCLGDMINGHDSTKEEAIVLIQQVITEEKKTDLPFHNLEGNHDNNIQSTWKDSGEHGPEVVLSPDELVQILEQPGEIHSPYRAMDYYVDFDNVGIRVICLSANYTTFSDETALWLREIALNTNKEVLVLSHCPTRPEWGYRNDVVNGDIIEKELLDFCHDGGTVIAFIHGHDHGDMIEVAEELPWTGIAVGCAKFSVPTSGATLGMTYAERNENDETKVLFDVVRINKEKRQIEFVRFGAGEDRKINY